MEKNVRPQVRAVVFNVGETLIDETTEYHAWADWLGVPRHTFSAAFGGVVARGEDYRQGIRILQSRLRSRYRTRRREQAGIPEQFDARDLYPDARPFLEALKQQGYFLGIAGNQTARAERLLHQLRLPVNFIGTSEACGVEKPSPAFFEKIISKCDHQPAEIAYVGDRPDNDIRPALAAGMVVVFLWRGPWGVLWGDDRETESAHIRLRTLTELPDLLKIFNRSR